MRKYLNYIINLFLLPIFPPSSHPIVVFFFPIGLSSLSHSQLVLLGFYNDGRSTGKKNTTIECDDSGKIGDKNKLILTNIYNTHFYW